MRKNLSAIPLVSILVSTLTMSGCSSGDGGGSAAAAPVYSGNLLPAAISTGSAEEMGRSATEGVNESVNLMTTGSGIPFIPLAVETNSSSAALVLKIREIALKALQNSGTRDLPAGVVMTFDQLNAQTNTNEFCGGSVAMPDPNTIDQNAPLNFTMTFNQLCYDDGITAMVMNGVLTFAETDTAFSISFSDFSVNIDGKQESFTGTFTCGTSSFDCAISTDFAGSDGSIFRLENVDINGDEFFGYTLSADFYHHEQGMVSISTTAAVTYGNCGIFPHGGAISLSGSGASSMSVTFNSDCTFTVQGFDGSNSFGPDTLSWAI